MELAHIPLNRLKISAQNMRHSQKKPDISDILPSIKERGIQQPLLVRKHGKNYEIIAGRRRYFSLKELEKKDNISEPVPCAIMKSGDDATALEASLIENIARCDPDEMTRFETFSLLVKKGKTAKDIALTFGVSELMVKRSLALGNLIPAIREAYRNEDIGAKTIRLLTLANEKQQKEWFGLFNDPEEQEPSSWQLKQWLFGGDIKTSCALFPLNDYKGEIIADLFGEDCYFDDVEKFWKLQNQAIAKKRDELIKHGWSEVVIFDVGKHFSNWDYVETSKEDGGHVYICASANGEVNLYEGFITDKEFRTRAKASLQITNNSEVQSRPELTKAAQNYIILHRHGAVRTALLKQENIALRLMVAHVIAGSHNWNIKADPQRADKESIEKSISQSKSQTAFNEERKEILKLLKLPKHSNFITQAHADEESTLEIFIMLLELSDKDVMRILTFIMAETLQAGTCIIETLGNKLSLNMNDCWQVDDIFLTLLRDKGAINAMLKHIGGKQVADANISATAKVQKKIISDFISGDGRKKAENWLPHYMEFPFKAYTKAGAGQVSLNAKMAK